MKVDHATVSTFAVWPDLREHLVSCHLWKAPRLRQIAVKELYVQVEFDGK